MNEQQKFWSKEYAKEYIEKNSKFNLEMRVKGWAKMLNSISNIRSILECGSNIGRNINFLNHLLPNADKSIIEISPEAFQSVINQYRIANAYNGAILDAEFKNELFDLVYTCGVLIHVHPNDLEANMRKMYNLSSKYILIAEYFNRTPIMIEYQGKQDRLFKRDFGKLFIEKNNVTLKDHGFLWGYEFDCAGFDDITYWLFEKK